MNIEDTPQDVIERLANGQLTDQELMELSMPCPQGCGRTTEDPYGGPCRACWDEVS